MENNNYPFELKAYDFSFKIFKEIIFALNAFFIGFWLGVLKREHYHLVDSIYYNQTEMYRDENYNKRGLWDWEEKVLAQYFQQCHNLLVVAAGGGREVLALCKRGYEVDGFECNANLLKFANNLIKQEEFASHIKLAPRDQCPDSQKEYDGLIVGWGAYMLIQGKERRIEFLRQLRTQAKKNSPVLLSFFCYSETTGGRDFKAIAMIGNAFRRLLGRECLEVGDNLAPNYVHYFTKDEIASELQAGGFELKIYCTNQYGHAVGIAV
uniref:DivMT n=1 Tax=Prochloron didemni TaxID=1216 RepID=A0A2H4GZ91_PRODI|nr:DivMT [Prochloron didemni]